MKSILVVDDERNIVDLLRLYLEKEGFGVIAAGDGEQALALHQRHDPDLVILDLMLPKRDGFEVCREIRKRGETPVIMLTARGDDVDAIVGLELGADDYVTKPFSVLELVARVKAIFRRVDSLASRADSAEQVIENGALAIDVVRREVWLAGRPVELTATEFDLLLHFARHPGRVFSRTQLLDQVWGYSHSGYEHTVNSHINRLRAKIEANANQPELIQTVWGVGYKFRDAARNADAS